MNRQIIEISWGSLWRILLMIFFGIALYVLREVFVILALALTISSAVDAPATYLESKKIPRILSVLFIFLAALAVLAMLLYTIVPVAIVEFRNILNGIDKMNIPELNTFINPHFIKNIESNLSNITDALFAGSASFLDFFSAVFGSIAFVVAVFVLSFYLAASRDGVEKFIKAILPQEQEYYVLKIYNRTRSKLGKWLHGQLLLSFIVGFFIFIGLLIFGVKYSILLGILGGILEMVPFVGPVITGFLAVLIAVSQSWFLAITVGILFVVIQQLENHILVPLVMKRTVGLHPVVVVIAVLAGAQMAGLAGVILSVPVAVLIQEIIEDWADKKRQINEAELV